MSERYKLSEAQQASWTSNFDNLPRGTKAAAAKALDKVSVVSESSWRTLLSGFFKGTEKEIRAVFEHDKRLETLAKVIGTTRVELEEWLDTSKGAPRQDAPWEVRIPGFEDFGPLPATQVLYPPPTLSSEWRLPPDEPGVPYKTRSQAGGNIDLDELVEISMSIPFTSQAIVFVGPSGCGKTTLLKALAAILELAGVTVCAGSTELVSENSVVICDDLDQLEPAGRRSLCEAVREQTCTLLTTLSSSDALEDLPFYRAVYQLGPRSVVWSLGFLSHLEAAAKQGWRLQLDLDPLKDWLEDNLQTASLGAQPRVLGLLARGVYDGRHLPGDHNALVALAVGQCALRIRRLGHASQALMLELCGKVVLENAAELACRRGKMSLELSDLARLFADASNGVAGRDDWAKLGNTGMVSVMQASFDGGLFLRRGSTIVPAIPTVFVAALGSRLVESLKGDQALLGKAALDGRWHRALVAAAEHLGDLTPLIDSLLSCTPPVLSQSIDALTKVVSTNVMCSKPNLFRRAFLLCLSWWARQPNPSRSVTFSFPVSVNAQGSVKGDQALINKRSPFVFLAVASDIHQAHLPQISHERVCSGQDVPEGLQRYLKLHEQWSLEPDVAQDAIALGAPRQSPRLLEARFWQRLPALGLHRTEQPFGFIEGDYKLWWRLVVGPFLLETDEGRAMLCGVREGFELRSCLNQGPRGTRIWQRAMSKQLAEGHHDTFVSALLITLRSGGHYNHEALRGLWQGLCRPSLKVAIRQSLTQNLVEIEPDRVWAGFGLLNWLFDSVLDPSHVQEVWGSWSQDHPDAVRWEAFRQGGVPLVELVKWAVETYPIVQNSSPPAPFTTTQFSGALLLQTREPRHSPQVEVLEGVVEDTDCPALQVIIEAGIEPWSLRGFRQLLSLESKDARKARFEIATKPSTKQQLRPHLLDNLIPLAGEGEQWSLVAQTSAHLLEEAERWSRWALVGGVQEPWEPLLDCLERLEDHLAQLEKDQNDAELSSLRQVSFNWLVSLDSWLGKADEYGVFSPSVVLEMLTTSPVLRLLCPPQIWIRACELVGYQVVVDSWTSQGVTAPHRQAWITGMCTLGRWPYIKSLLNHESLRSDILEVLSHPRVVVPPDILESLIGLIASREFAGERPARPFLALLAKWACSAPTQVVEFVEAYLRPYEVRRRKRWWEELIPQFADREAKRFAFEQYEETLPTQ